MQANDDIGMVLKSLSHDLRESLRSIRFRIMTIKEELPQKKTKLSGQLRKLDKRAKEFTDFIKEYREETAKNAETTFEEIAKVIEKEFQARTDELDELFGKLEVDAQQASFPSQELSPLKGMIQRLRSKIRSLHGYARSTGTLHLERFSLGPELERTIDDINATAREREATFHLSGQSLVVEADRNLLSLTFQNILQNSVRYTELTLRPEIYIEFLCGQSVNSRGEKIFDLEGMPFYFGLSVADNGIGIKESYKEKIFTPGFRMAQRMEAQGTGMGLAIVSQVVRKHNGIVQVESRSGGGSKFTILIPQERNPCP